MEEQQSSQPLLGLDGSALDEVCGGTQYHHVMVSYDNAFYAVTWGGDHSDYAGNERRQRS